MLKIIRNQKGMAVMELIPTLIIYILLINFALGFFGIVHSGILHNIAARNYTFETFRHRPSLIYHRTYEPDNNFVKKGFRYSGIVSDNSVAADKEWIAPTRPMAFMSNFGGTDSQNGIDFANRGVASEPNARTNHNVNVRNLNESVRNANISVSSVWIKSIYGICINAGCGDTN